jgi:hypothetical protein
MLQSSVFLSFPSYWLVLLSISFFSRNIDLLYVSFSGCDGEKATDMMLIQNIMMLIQNVHPHCLCGGCNHAAVTDAATAGMPRTSPFCNLEVNLAGSPL